MNEEKNIIVRMMDWLVDTLAKTLVSLFDGVKNAVDHANPSLFALVATLLPFLLPLPVAFMTAHSAQRFFDWDMWAANTLGFGLEGLGLLAWVKLVDAVLDQVRSNNAKVSNVVFLYGVVALTYEILLLFINVVLAQQEGADWRYVVVLACVCLLPALSALLYGHQRRMVETQLEKERREALEQKERERQERREDRRHAAELKLKYAKDAPLVKLEGDKPFRNGKRS
jgi:hypothetical protein